jgi:hypothetical protein
VRLRIKEGSIAGLAHGIRGVRLEPAKRELRDRGFDMRYMYALRRCGRHGTRKLTVNGLMGGGNIFQAVAVFGRDEIKNRFWCGGKRRFAKEDTALKKG